MQCNSETFFVHWEEEEAKWLSGRKQRPAAPHLETGWPRNAPRTRWYEKCTVGSVWHYMGLPAGDDAAKDIRRIRPFPRLFRSVHLEERALIG